MEFLKMDPRFRRQPKPKRAGWVAREVFGFLVQISADYDLRGRLSPSRQDLDWLADEWMTSRGDEEEVAAVLAIPLRDFLTRGIASCEEHGLLVREGEELLIDGWEQMYSRAKSQAERAADYRASRNVTPSVTPVTDVTVTKPVTSHATRRDETRRDETKQDRSAAPPVNPAVMKRCMDARETAHPTAVAENFAQLRPRFEQTLTEALAYKNMSEARFEAAYARFLKDPFWSTQDPPCPMGAFLAQWRTFVPDQGNSSAAAPTHRVLELIPHDKAKKAGGAA